MLHLDLISVMDGSTLNWFVQRVLQEAMSEEWLIGNITGRELKGKNFNHHFCEKTGEVKRSHLEV